ncbi:MAG: T9SS type A sorting domain-containing protein [bacterium]|nr:T9SS type A sorting domain-containing protein [bacterium]
MRKLPFYLFALLLFVGAQSVLAQPLPDCYHTRAEMYDYFLALQDSFPDKLRVDSIGHSRGEQLGEPFPLYAVKVSQNVAQFDDEPVVLIIAHIHAEEVAGMESTIGFVRKMLNNQQPYQTIREQIQLYVIPTMNPDGLEVISLGWDNTYRKNGYVPPEMFGDSCEVIPFVGEDSCGVDLNRNFDFNWIYGDTLWVRGSEEPFDYYRGPAPFSEPETRAVRDFAKQIKPTASIVWHSSRSGRVAERCIVAWQWGPDGAAKFSPDSAAIHQTMRGYVNKTVKYPSNTGHYLEVFGATRNGALHDWFYRELGTIQILTETSPPEQIQPPCNPNIDPNLPELAASLEPPMEWLCRRVFNFDRNGDMADQGAPLNIYTRDASNSQPISAEYRIVNTWSAVLKPWYTNAEYGRATFLPAAGSVTVMARKEGYRSDTTTVTCNPGGEAVYVTLDLDPLPWYNVTLNVRNANGDLLPARIYFDNGFPQTYDAGSGTLQVSKPQGVCAVRVEPLSGQLVARWVHFWLDGDRVVDVVLPNGSTLFAEDFEDGLVGWTPGGTGGAWRTDEDTTQVGIDSVLYTNPAGYRAQYGSDWNTTLTYNGAVTLSPGNAFHLKFDREGRLDMPADSFFVEVSSNGNDWNTVAGYSDLQVPWTTTFVDLNYFAGQTIHLRFRLKTDATLGDLGLHLDDLEILGGVDLASPDSPKPFPREFRMTNVYPNPFNPTTTIEYEAAAAGPLEFTIHNLLGQEVWSSNVTPPSPGHYEIRWNGTNGANQLLPSGIYFVRMAGHGAIYGTQKLMFLK